jgi:DNA-damage-inducible protein D
MRKCYSDYRNFEAVIEKARTACFNSDQQLEDEGCMLLRQEMRKHNVQLSDAARGAGVVEPMDYAIFQNHGYAGLYGGLMAQDIHGPFWIAPLRCIRCIRSPRLTG